jgi:thiamine biosynthesis lipoprotein
MIMRSRAAHKTILHFISLAVCSALALSLCGCNKVVTKSFTTFDYLDTVIKLTVNAASEEKAEIALNGCIDTIKRLHEMLDADGGGFVGRLNRGETVSLTDEERELLNSALSMCERTNGALDITLYPLSKLWDIGGSNHIPTDAELSETLRVCGYQSLPELKNEYKLPEGMALDFGAVAKGRIADILSQQLKAEGITGALIDLGGNIYALGKKTDGSLYRIAVQSPVDTSESVAVVEGENISVVTSGNYQRYFDFAGVRYHHIMDAETGAPARSGLLSVTVIAPSSFTADCLSTALFVLGEQRGAELLEGFDDVSAIFVREDAAAVLYESKTAHTYKIIMKGSN